MGCLRSTYNSYIIVALYGIKLLMAVTIHTNNVGKKASRNYPSNQIYTQLTPYGIVPVNNVSLEFQVKACNDAFVLLSSASDLNSRFLYEIVIGSRANTAMFLRRKYGGKTALMSGIKAIVLSCDEYTNLFVNWSNSSRITVGNYSHTFIDWTDPYPFMIEGYGIMTGWGSNGSWIFNLEAIAIHTDNVGRKDSRKYSSYNIYTHLTPYGILPVDGVSFEFQVKACNDAFVLLSSASDLNSTSLYEIVIGSRANTAIFLRRKYGGKTALMSGIKAIVLSCDEYTNLFVNWSNSSRITVGNYSHTFIDWTDPYPFMIEGYGIMTGWGSNGSWIFNLEETTCECECTTDIPNLSNYTHAELLEILDPEITKIRQYLLVDTTQLSSTIRRLTSAPDDRKSSKGVGLIAVVLFVSLFGTVAVIDIPALVKQSKPIRQLCRRICSKINIGAIKRKH